jgi:hypothetical protein
MEQFEPARPQAHASRDELRATRKVLEDAGVPSDVVATDSQVSELKLPDSGLSQHSVQPSAGMLNALGDTDGNRVNPQDEHNQRDSDADIVG